MKRAILITTCLLFAGFAMARAEDVKDTWEKECQRCHGADGKGDTKMGKKLEVRDYTAPAVQAKMKDDEMAKAIKEGVKDNDGKTRMKAFGETLSEDQVKALVAYIRAFKK